MKMQLDKEALERLIGGNSEIEVELRNAVVQDFSKRHLKGIMTEDAIISIRKELEPVMLQALHNEFNKYFSDRFTNVLGKNFIDQIEHLVQHSIDRELYKAVTNQVEEYLKKVQVDESITKIVNYYINNEVNKRVKDKISKAITNLKE